MATLVQAWKARDGRVFEKRELAEAADRDTLVGELCLALAKAIKPAYSDEDEIADGLRANPELVIALASAMTGGSDHAQAAT